MTAVSGVVSVKNCVFSGGYRPAADNTFIATQYVMSASATGLIPAQSASFAVSSYGGGTQLAFTQQPLGVASATATAVFTQQPIVALEDSFGNLVINQKNSSGNVVALSISLQTPEVSSGCSASFSNGLFTVSGCAGSAYGTNVVMNASGTGVTTAQSSAFNITGVPTQLLFTTEPVAGQAGSILATEPVLTVEDASGRVVTAATSAATLTVAPSSGVLTVCTNLVPTYGVISVSNCNFNGTVGVNYYMTAALSWAGANLTATSTAFLQPGREEPPSSCSPNRPSRAHRAAPLRPNPWSTSRTRQATS